MYTISVHINSDSGVGTYHHDAYRPTKYKHNNKCTGALQLVLCDYACASSFQLIVCSRTWNNKINGIAGTNEANSDRSDWRQTKRRHGDTATTWTATTTVRSATDKVKMAKFDSWNADTFGQIGDNFGRTLTLIPIPIPNHYSTLSCCLVVAPS